MPKAGWRIWTTIATVSAVASGCADLKAPRSEVPEHLVLIVLDTARADRMSLYGHDRPTTPFLDAIADELVVFERAAAVGAWTVPNHATLFSGRLPSEHRAQWGRMVLGDEEVTLAEQLAAEGFCTEAWSANPLAGPKTGLSQGFDRFEVVKGAWPEKTAKILDELPGLFERMKSRECRSFVFLNWMDAHIPYNAHRFEDEFGVRAPGPVPNARIKWEISSGRRTLTREELSSHRAAYDAAIRHLDWALEQLFTELESAGLLDRTLVVITSDHGDGLGAHREIGHSLSVWEEQLSVPLVVRMPKAARGGERIASRTSLRGVAPSLFDWLAVPRPSHLEGAPTLEEPASVVADYRSYFSEQSRGTNQNMTERYPELAAATPHQHVLYCDGYKLMVRSDGSLSFFDVESDPDEQNDLGVEATTELRQCRAQYRRRLGEGLFTPFDAVAEEGDVSEAPDLETLRALGYVQ